MTAIRQTLEAALAKPVAPDGEPTDEEHFDPWVDLMRGIHGSYSSASDDLAIAVLEAVRDRHTFGLIERRGFAAEFMLYCLSGFGLTEYGTSPRGGFPDPAIRDLWQPLIDKWTAYADAQWGADGWREER